MMKMKRVTELKEQIDIESESKNESKIENEKNKTHKRKNSITKYNNKIEYKSIEENWIFLLRYRV